MQDEVYSDGIAEITVTGPIVRVDLMSLSPTERDAENNPKAVFRQRIVMPVDAFANSVDLMRKAVQGLIDAGAIKPPLASPADEKSTQAGVYMKTLPNRARNPYPKFLS
jgi:hypothetical protein